MPSSIPVRPSGAVTRNAIVGLGSILSAGFALALPSAAQSYPLNSPFEFESVVGDVQDFAVKYNGNFVFFLADARRPGVVELFTAPAQGGAVPFQENGHLKTDRSVVAYRPSPVGNWIVFLADQDADEVFELYSRKPSDTKPRKLSGALVAGGDVLDDFVISPDATRVVFRADRDTDEVFELYSVPIDASASAVRISGAMVAGGDVPYSSASKGAFEVSPCGCRVVYVADQQTDEQYELFSVPIDGSASPVRLNATFPPGGDVAVPHRVGITPDGATVVYRADQDADELYEAFRVPIDGSASPVQLHPALVPGGDVAGVTLTPDGERALYRADQDTDGVQEIYSVRLDGSAPVKLNVPGQSTVAGPVAADSSRMVLLAPGGVMSVPVDGSASPVLLTTYPDAPATLDALAISPDSSRLVYRTTVPDNCEGACIYWDSLRSVPLDGSASPVRLDDVGGIVVSPSFAPRTPFAFSADSSRVVYEWNDGVSVGGLYSVPIDRSAAPAALAIGPIGPLFATAPAGSRAFFTADFPGTGAFELHSVQLTNGTGLAKLSAELARDTFADVEAFALEPAGERVVHSADPIEDGSFQLHARSADRSDAQVALTSGATVLDFVFSPDGERIVYRPSSDPLFANRGDLHSVPADGGASPVKLNATLAAGEWVGGYRVTGDGARVVYAIMRFQAPSTLYSVPVAGGSPIQLEDSFSRFGLFRLAPGGDRAAYVVRSTGPTGEQEQLHSVPVDGSAAPIPLSPVMSGSIDLEVSPDGSRIAYRGMAAVFSVPSDGSAGEILLSGSLSSAASPRVSPDGQWVVFRAADGGGNELFSARIDGSFGPVSLTGPLVAGGNVHAPFGVNVARISPDSSRVVYTADADVDEVYEVYSAPIDASSSPVKLSGALVSGGDALLESTSTLHVQITPDGTRALFLADRDADEVLELYSAPLDGSAGPTKLNGALTGGGDVSAYRISPDSTRVVYSADQDIDGRLELFLVPLDASRPPRKLNWPLVGSGVGSFEITADSRRVVYRATEYDQVTELFGSLLEFEAARPPAALRGSP